MRISLRTTLHERVNRSRDVEVTRVTGPTAVRGGRLLARREKGHIGQRDDDVARTSSYYVEPRDEAVGHPWEQRIGILVPKYLISCS